MKKLTSFIDSAADSLFSIYNLPYGVFHRRGETNARIGTAIGDFVLDLAVLEQTGLLPSQNWFNQPRLNVFAAQPKASWDTVRTQLQSLLSIDNPTLQNNTDLLALALVPQQDIVMQPPFHVQGFSDFYASEHHATNVGKLFRGKENALMPNWKYLPVGYNGRASTVFLSGTPIPRPKGQIKLPDQDAPIFAPSKKLDFELEMGLFIGAGNPDGHRIGVSEATEHLFGLVLLNDWSARDIQAFEYQPLGPFLSKSFATSISPWVVPMQALQDFMTPLPTQTPATVDYLTQPQRHLPRVKLSVAIRPHGSKVATTICETHCTELYWSLEQMLAHHTVNHCIMKPGDLLGTGTISGPNRENWGSLLEITFNGTQPLILEDGKERRFLEDGDTVIMTGYCENDHYKIGFGTLEGTITGTQ